ncbi:MAG TPA: thioredoxin-dependent thiol peroxidase [Cellvibrio sp.]|nr:thioredoxin-dependent thiol peroxidase [Cellvibrio sp.]
MTHPKIGKPAPDFTLLDQNGKSVTLKQFRGKSNVVIYFYPKASTPGCTTQACGIRDSALDLRAINTVVLGISPDAPVKLQKFDSKYGLDFTLLSDEDHAVAEAYGVWALKKFMGREFMGVVRSSFLVDIEGQLRYIFEKVNTKTHNFDIINYIKDNI